MIKRPGWILPKIKIRPCQGQIFWKPAPPVEREREQVNYISEVVLIAFSCANFIELCELVLTNIETLPMLIFCFVLSCDLVNVCWFPGWLAEPRPKRLGVRLLSILTWERHQGVVFCCLLSNTDLRRLGSPWFFWSFGFPLLPFLGLLGQFLVKKMMGCFTWEAAPPRLVHCQSPVDGCPVTQCIWRLCLYGNRINLVSLPLKTEWNLLL